jgi:hypothetical protein
MSIFKFHNNIVVITYFILRQKFINLVVVIFILNYFLFI